MVDIIVKIVVGVAVSLITTFLIPAISKWIGNLEDTKLKKFIANAVRAAEQMYGPKTGAIKVEYVRNLVKEKTKGKLSDETIDTLIEAAVYEISQAVKNEQTEATQANVEEATAIKEVTEEENKKAEEVTTKSTTKINLG